MSVTIIAKPRPYTFKPGRTAVIGIDRQNDFGAVGGYVDSFGVPLVRSGDRSVRAVNGNAG